MNCNAKIQPHTKIDNVIYFVSIPVFDDLSTCRQSIIQTIFTEMNLLRQNQSFIRKRINYYFSVQQINFFL